MERKTGDARVIVTAQSFLLYTVAPLPIPAKHAIPLTTPACLTKICTANGSLLMNKLPLTRI